MCTTFTTFTCLHVHLFQLKELVEPDETNPRVSWGIYLTSVCKEIPSDVFRDWQNDSFQMSLRYLRARPVPPPCVNLPPPPQAPLPRPMVMDNSSQQQFGPSTQQHQYPGPSGSQQQFVPSSQQHQYPGPSSSHQQFAPSTQQHQFGTTRQQYASMSFPQQQQNFAFQNQNQNPTTDGYQVSNMYIFNINDKSCIFKIDGMK